MLRSVKVPEGFEGPFARAEQYVESLFASLSRSPEQGVLRIGEQRYVLVRCESLYLSWFDAMAETFGAETAREFIYNTAREIGRADAKDFCQRLGVTDGIERLSAGPVHFAHCGWALVEILGDSRPAMDDTYYLHYYHPNTFEAEALRARGKVAQDTACLFSAGYSAGWCSEAFGVDVHAREIQCTARGNAHCEFIMAPSARLDALELELLRRRG
ncbi:MAG: XylR N-terminal domain-containing protein [Polyangiaceae bacterium]|nr:XylR N-terminal domain-containing protein [Polyangiaceae bacterium]